MKKILTVLLSLSVLFVVAGCSSVKDGTYTAKASAPNEYGTTPFVNVTIANGKITAVTIDETAQDGTLKSQQSKDGTYDMSPAGAQWPWHEQVAALETYLVNNQGSKITSFDADGKTDAVSGCTIKVKDYIDLFNTAYNQAKKQ
ncbi:MAG: FMN-binding protein [Treponema sp.]|nr:FMN-binding protein [Treponema sp.]